MISTALVIMSLSGVVRAGVDVSIANPAGDAFFSKVSKADDAVTPERVKEYAMKKLAQCLMQTGLSADIKATFDFGIGLEGKMLKDPIKDPQGSLLQVGGTAELSYPRVKAGFGVVQQGKDVLKTTFSGGDFNGNKNWEGVQSVGNMAIGHLLKEFAKRGQQAPQIVEVLTKENLIPKAPYVHLEVHFGKIRIHQDANLYEALGEIGEPARKALEVASKDKDPEISEEAKVVLEKLKKAAEKSNVVITGKVKNVTMQTSQVEINMFTATITENRDKSVSLVNIELVDNPDETFKIPVNDIVELPPFQDLKGRHQMLGGLLILSPLQSKLVDKDVKLSCLKAAGDAKKMTYLVRKIEIAGFTSDSEPRFNGQVAFKNESDVAVWVDGVAGFDEEVTCGQVRPGGTQIVFKNPAKIPDQVTITWREENHDPQKSVVDFGGIRKAGKSGTISLHFTKDRAWRVELQ